MGITRRRESGQLLVVFALTLSALLAVIGLLFTFGLVLAQRRTLQTAADAASLRGSWQILQQLAANDLKDIHVQAAITPFATSNGFPAGGVITAYYVDAYGQQLCPPVQVGVGRLSDQTVPLNARGVQVIVQNDVATFLPNFLSGWQGNPTADNRVLTTAARATATARPAALASAQMVVPLAISANAAAAAYTDSLFAINVSGHPTYDLFASTQTLDLTTTMPDGTGATAHPALTWGDPATNERSWSDGAHIGTWAMAQPGTVAVAPSNPDASQPNDVAYHVEIAKGLRDWRDRLTPPPSVGPPYPIVTVPVYDEPIAGPLHIIGFAEFVVIGPIVVPTDTTTQASVMGRFVPYAVPAYGPIVAYSPPGTLCSPPPPPTPPRDFGAAQVSIVS